MLHASGSNCCALMWGHEKGEGNTHTHFALRTRVRAVLWSPLFVLCCGLPCSCCAVVSLFVRACSAVASLVCVRAVLLSRGHPYLYLSILFVMR